MRGDLFALYLLVSGLGCILAWGICQWVVAVRTERLRRVSDELKMHLIKGGRMPDGTQWSLAKDYFSLRWLAIAGNLLLVAGIGVLIVLHFTAF